MTAPAKFTVGSKVPIHDVKTKKLRLMPDDRGWLMEILRADETELFTKFGQTYVSATYPGVVKAWHYHRTGRHFAWWRECEARLIDKREGSPTNGAVNEFSSARRIRCSCRYRTWSITAGSASASSHPLRERHDGAVSSTATRTNTGSIPRDAALRLDRKVVKVLVTGGAGFIGSNFVRSRWRRSRLAGDHARQGTYADVSRTSRA